jgi:hypothetical protein
MKMDRKLVSLILLSFLTLSMFSVLGRGRFQANAQPPPASLTGTIHDEGVDTDADGDFNFLEVGVEVDVLEAGYYSVDVSGLADSSFNYIGVWDSEYLFLDVGIQVVNLSLYGPAIYTSGLNPAYVVSIHLYREDGKELESLYDVPLSQEYLYTEFDPPPAFLTGTIHDQGVDTDGDGDFNYLEVGVEVNVTTAGYYEVEVSVELEDSGYVYVHDYEDMYLDVGVHVVNLSLYGPTIYSSRTNPVNVSNIDLWSNPTEDWRTWLGSRHDVPLSHQYFYHEFDAPFADAEAKLTVYPDGRVVMGGALNYTHMAPPYEGGIEMFGDTSFTRTDGSTEMLANFAFIVQPQLADTFPFNSSSFNLLGTYSGDMADISINGSVTFPPSLASQFPLNLSDFTVVADYLDNEINGTITAPLISGMPIATIDVDFHGNLTDLYLSDELEIIYGTFFDYEVNETMVEELLLQINSTIPGTGPESLYNMTEGILECTRLNTTMIKKVDGANITFDAHIHGDFVQLFVFAMTGGQGDPGLYWFANALVSSVETGDFELAYAHQFGEASMELSFTANFTKLWSDLESTMPEEIPPEQRTPVELLLNTTLCSVDSADVVWTYENGRSDLHIEATIGPDLNAELNFIKTVAVTYGMPQPPPLEWLIINETEIDLSNLSVTFNLTRTSFLCIIEGFEIMPPIDPADSDTTQFKLEQLLSLTEYAFPYGEPPVKDSRLKITIEGGYNSTHTVILFRPPTVPEPDITSLDYKTMTWENVTMSSLKDLVFRIAYQEAINYLGRTYYALIFTNSTESNFTFNPSAKSISFNVTGATGTGFCNITIPRALLYAALGEWAVKIDGITLNPAEYSVTENDEYVFIYLNYSHSSHLIEIEGTWIVTEFQPNMLPLILVIISLIAAMIAVKQRKKLGTLKTKYQSVIRTFANRLHELRS